jgi:hypothetical protein
MLTAVGRRVSERASQNYATPNSILI